MNIFLEFKYFFRKFPLKLFSQLCGLFILFKAETFLIVINCDSYYFFMSDYYIKNIFGDNDFFFLDTISTI